MELYRRAVKLERLKGKLGSFPAFSARLPVSRHIGLSCKHVALLVAIHVRLYGPGFSMNVWPSVTLLSFI